MAYLVLVRHGQSEWNKKGLWTGLVNAPLSPEGEREAAKAADSIKDIPFNVAFTSKLVRAHQTLDIILKILQKSVPITENEALNERNYGDLTGKNKWKIKEQYGDEQFLKWRRGWDVAIPNGETLKDVYNRVVPNYLEQIEPIVKAGKNVLVVAHGNSIRALIKYLEHISDEEVVRVELGTGEIYIYHIDNRGNVIAKEVRARNEKPA
ncbi:MAG: 2,3-diphosphoglycerate-dependent phosphoglycerate mutase [Candidatus Levybacteria bacterium]|nr:2,3-diphosphoglycerate-dependent phosphoglycerate mutase [Candidatus Levybacteria bacterium]